MWENFVETACVMTIKKFFEGKDKKESDLISVGLAVGYYYNFLEPLSSEINRDEFTISASKDGDNKRMFPAEDVRVQIIIPGKLDVFAFDRCETDFKTLHKGFIYLRQQKRYYGINYSLTTLPSKVQLTIVDLARPVMSIKRYYEDILQLDTTDSESNWMKIQSAEILAFKESVRRLQSRGYGALVNKLDFADRL